MDADGIADLMLKLQEDTKYVTLPSSIRDLTIKHVAYSIFRCHNVNFVTPEHVVPQVVEALAGVATAAGIGVGLVDHSQLAFGSLVVTASSKSERQADSVRERSLRVALAVDQSLPLLGLGLIAGASRMAAGQ